MTEKEGFRVSMENYRKSARTLALVSENVVGIPLSKRTASNWETIMYALRIGDDRIDAIIDPAVRARFKVGMMGYLKGDKPLLVKGDERLSDSMTKLRELCDGLSESEKNILLITFESLLKVTEKLRYSKDPACFSLLTRLEGQITARLFLNTLPTEYTDSPRYGALVKTLTRFGRVANSVDNFADLVDDYKEGLVVTEPSTSTRFKLILRSITDAYEVIKHLKFSLHLFGEILVRAKATTENNPRAKL